MSLNRSASLEDASDKGCDGVVVVVVDNNHVIDGRLLAVDALVMSVLLVQRLHGWQVVVSQAESKCKQQDTQAKTNDAHLLLDDSVRQHKGTSCGSAPFVGQDEGQWSAVSLGVQGVSAFADSVDINTQLNHVVTDLAWHELSPDSTGNGRSQGGANVVGGQVKGDDHGHVLVVGTGSNRDLGGVSEETSTETHDTQTTDDTLLVESSGDTIVVTSEVKEETHGKEPHATAEKNKALGSSDLNNDETQEWASDDGHERVQRGDTLSGDCGSVHTGDQHSVHVVVRHVPDKVDETSDQKSGPNTTVLQEVERNDWESSTLPLPENESWNQNDTNTQWGNNVSLVPSSAGLNQNTSLVTGKGEWDQDETENANDEKNTDDVELPEQVNEDSLSHKVLLLLTSDSLPLGGLASHHSHVNHASEQGNRGQWEDESPHTDWERPAVSGKQLLKHVTGGPSVNDEWKGRNEGSEQTPVQVRHVGQGNFQDQSNTGVTNLVQDSTSGETSNIPSSGFDDSTDNVKHDCNGENF